MMNIVRYGATERMHPEVRKISINELAKNLNLDAQFNSKDISSLRADEKALRDKIEIISKNPHCHDTVLGDQLNETKKKLVKVQDAINKKLGKEPRISRDTYHKLIEGANIICTTISSSITLQQ